MIDLQSPIIVEKRNHRPCYSPSPWGEGRGEGELYLCERSERHFLCCSGTGRDEGEPDHRGRQSALISCPSGHSKILFKVSQAHSRLFKGIQPYSRVF